MGVLRTPLDNPQDGSRIAWRDGGYLVDLGAAGRSTRVRNPMRDAKIRGRGDSPSDKN